MQSDLFASASTPPAVPEGFGYAPGVVTAPAQADLLWRLASLPFRPFDFHGFKANRQVVSFGLRYDYARNALTPADPIPDFILTLINQAAAAFNRPAEDFTQVLVNAYSPGAGIGWHRDKPHFDEVIGISLGAPCKLRFRRPLIVGWERRTADLAPGSAYLLSGPARREWQHSIAPMAAQRFSITLRSLNPR